MDSVTIGQTGPLDAVVRVPGSKSLTARAMVAAALASGASVLRDAAICDDTVFMADGLRALGVEVELSGNAFRISGTGGSLGETGDTLFLGNAGTAMRFLTAVACLGRGLYVLDGSPRMRERPIQYLLDALSSLGATARSVEGNGCPPVQIEAEGIQGGVVAMRGDKSSQYFTAILLAAPYASHDVKLRVEGDLVSKPYVDMTTDVMRDFGVSVERDGYESFTVSAGQIYDSRDYIIEGDWSAASYFLAAAAITGGKVRVENVSPESRQGDKGFVQVLERMGCRSKVDPKGVEIQSSGKLGGIDVDLNAMPDVAQTLAVTALFTEGETTIRSVANLRLKECDRISATATELEKLGATVEEFPDGLRILPGELHGAEIDTYDDHRMAMSFALAGLRVPDVVIKNPDCVTKTFPDFFKTLESISG
jgi:3-phosphoshikimate 1-carboxyvinyltransferase